MGFEWEREQGSSDTHFLRLLTCLDGTVMTKRKRMGNFYSVRDEKKDRRRQGGRGTDKSGRGHVSKGKWDIVSPDAKQAEVKFHSFWKNRRGQQSGGKSQ